MIVGRSKTICCVHPQLITRGSMIKEFTETEFVQIYL